MTSSLTVLITSACIGMSGAGQEMCSKSLEAGAIQSGVDQNMDVMQKNVERKADRNARKVLGNSGMEVVGGGIFITKTIIDKSVKFNVPTLGVCDRITNQVGVDKYTTTLEWGF